MKSLLFISLLISAFTYDRDGAVNYAYQYAKTPNHKCGNYLKCTPASYFGREACGYESHGGDCANFVSQCLVLGGNHPKLNGGSEICRGYPCGFEEIGAWELGECLSLKGWTSTCGYRQAPPDNIKPGDVLIYHSDGCNSGASHAVLVTKGGPNAKITCHSSVKIDVDYDYQANSKPYYHWLHYEG